MLVSVLAIIVGFALLVWSADKFVLGSANVARSMGVSPLMIGITVVGFGTSAPEILVSVMAAAQGNSGIALGNAIGSNITNVALILGITALVAPIIVRSEIVKREIPILFVVMLLSLIVLLDAKLTRTDGVILLIGQVGVLYLAFLIGKKEAKSQAIIDDDIEDLPLKTAFFWLAAGLLVLLGSSKILVWGATDIAQRLGVSDLIIGLTVIALGTSLPELAASISSVRRKHYDMALGNVIGSNMFNLLSVLGVASVVAPITPEPAVLTRDFPFMIGLTIALFVMGYGFKGPGKITRLEGTLLVIAYIFYQATLFFSVIKT